MHTNFKSDAIVLFSKPYSEADKIITLFTKDFGKLVVIAKGVKRLKSRKRGSLENFSHIRFQAAKSRGMPILIETEILNSFSSWKKDISKVSVAYYFAEVLKKVTQEEEPHYDVYLLFLSALGKLEDSRNLKKLRYAFSTEVLKKLGFWPEDKVMLNPDYILEELTEKRLSSVRVGKKLLT